MNLSIDGSRKNLVLDINNLKNELDHIFLEAQEVAETDEAKDAFNCLAQSINMFLCACDDNNDEFNDLSGLAKAKYYEV